MKYFIRLTERASTDPQEARAMAQIRRRSIEWMFTIEPLAEVEYIFRTQDNRASILFVDISSHLALHKFIDADPLISHCEVDVEPLLTPVEMVDALSEYLKIEDGYFTPQQMKEIEFPKQPIKPDGSYYLARKKLAPFSALLPIEQQDKIHHNTMSSQRAHFEEREIADYNPVGKPVGILLMEANNWDEVIEHVMNCEVFIDSSVEGTRLLTLQQAHKSNDDELRQYLVGVFSDDL